MSANGVHEEKRDRDCGVEKPGPVVLRSAMMRLAIVECVSAEDLEDVVHGLVIAAREGSVSAARLLLKYVFDEKALAEAEKVAERAGAWDLPLTPDPSPPRGEGRIGGGNSDFGSGKRRDAGQDTVHGWDEGRSDGAESGKAIVVEERSGRSPIMHVDLERLYQEAGEKLMQEMDEIRWKGGGRVGDVEDGDSWAHSENLEMSSAGLKEPACMGSEEPACMGSEEPACMSLEKPACMGLEKRACAGLKEPAADPCEHVLERG